MGAGIAVSIVYADDRYLYTSFLITPRKKEECTRIEKYQNTTQVITVRQTYETFFIC